MAEEQAKTEKTVTKKVVFLAVLMTLGLIAAGYFFSLKIAIATAIFILLLVLTVFFFKGFDVVQQQERVVVEFFGRYWKEKKPGLRWNFPGIIKVRAVVSIWELALILFDKPIKIDFKDGSATPKGAKAFVKIKKPDEPYQLEEEKEPRTGVFRAVYFVLNWRDRAVELLENAVRSYLATLTIDEALPKKRGGFDLLTANRIPKSEKSKIKKALDQWGLELLRITVTDFDLEPDLVRARGDVQKKKRAVETAEFEKKVRAHETVGALIQMLAEARGKTFSEIQKEIEDDEGLKNKIMDFSQELVTRQMSIDGKALTDVRVSGAGGDILKSLLALIAAHSKLSTEKEKRPQKEKKEEEPQKEGL